MTRLGFLAATLLAGVALVTSAQAQTVTLDELRKANPEKKIAKLQAKIEDLKGKINKLKDQLANIEPGIEIYPTGIGQSVRASARKGSELYVGTGIPPTEFLILEIDGIELGLKFHLRQGGDIPITSIDDQGRFHVEVPSGPQPSVSNRAAWNVTFSVDTGVYGLAALADRITLRLDVNPGAGTNFVDLHLTQLGSDPDGAGDKNGFGWVTDGGFPEIGDDEGTTSVTQNSYNYAFIDNLPGGAGYNFTPGTFEIQLVFDGETAIKTVVEVKTPPPSPKVARR